MEKIKNDLINVIINVNNKLIILLIIFQMYIYNYIKL